MNLGPMEILFILVAALVLFGPKRLPELGRSLGKGIREFRRGTQGLKEELEQSFKEDAAPHAAQAAQVPPSHQSVQSAQAVPLAQAVPVVPVPQVTPAAAPAQVVYTAAPDAVGAAPVRASDLAVQPAVSSPVTEAAPDAVSQTTPGSVPPVPPHRA